MGLKRVWVGGGGGSGEVKGLDVNGWVYVGGVGWSGWGRGGDEGASRLVG